jgi:hypothetical protein
MRVHDAERGTSCPRPAAAPTASGQRAVQDRRRAAEVCGRRAAPPDGRSASTEGDMGSAYRTGGRPRPAGYRWARSDLAGDSVARPRRTETVSAQAATGDESSVDELPVSGHFDPTDLLAAVARALDSGQEETPVSQGPCFGGALVRSKGSSTSRAGSLRRRGPRSPHSPAGLAHPAPFRSRCGGGGRR